MEKANYRKVLRTEIDEKVIITTYDNNSDIYLRLIDNDDDCAIVQLTMKEAQRVQRYLEDAITRNSMNWEEE